VTRIRFAGAVAILAAALFGGVVCAPTDPAAAAPVNQSGTVHPDGFESGSVITQGNCKGWLNTEQQSGKWYAQGLIQSWNSQRCYMYLERYHNGSWTIISGEHIVVNTQDHTGYYYDDAGYKARVCVSSSSTSAFFCGGAI
jgi:hypothetical protein